MVRMVLQRTEFKGLIETAGPVIQRIDSYPANADLPGQDFDTLQRIKQKYAANTAGLGSHVNRQAANMYSGNRIPGQTRSNIVR